MGTQSEPKQTENNVKQEEQGTQNQEQGTQKQEQGAQKQEQTKKIQMGKETRTIFFDGKVVETQTVIKEEQMEVISQDVIEELRKMFGLIDTKESGLITWLQLRKALRKHSTFSFGMSAESKTNAIFEHPDKNKGLLLYFLSTRNFLFL